MTKQIVGICGSLRKDSYNLALLKKAVTFLPENYEFTLADISNIPLYNQDLEENVPASVQDLTDKIKSADALIISTPEYNHSVPGVLKNAIDWLSRPVVDSPIHSKRTALIGGSPSRFGTVRSQNHLRDVMFALNMNLINQPEVLVSEVNKTFNENGELEDTTVLELLEKVVDQLVKEVE